MFTYINEELPRVAAEHFPVSLRNKSITGYSMGGHGAIVSQIRTNNSYKSVSAFSPISNPSQSELCMKGYE
jgi:S-formylglutathione hydrolase